MESTDRRVLGGFVCVDSITRASIQDPLNVTSSLTLRANRSGVYAMFNAPGFSALTSQFNPAAAQWPAAQYFEVTVQDPTLRYLARRARVQAPQGLPTAWVPQQISLYASPAALLSPNWAVVRASVTGSSGAGLPWAVVQIIKSDHSVAATGMTDDRGEALLAVTGLGVQVSSSSSGSVTETTIPVTVQAWFDVGTLTQPADWIPNPDDILGNLSSSALKTASLTGTLGARQILLAPIKIST